MDNPHSDFEVEEGEFFIVNAPETAECFRCLIENRSHCSLYKGNRTGYVNDPMGIRLAYDMRDALKRDCWAMLPPDTLSLVSRLHTVRNGRQCPKHGRMAGCRRFPSPS